LNSTVSEVSRREIMTVQGAGACCLIVAACLTLLLSSVMSNPCWA